MSELLAEAVAARASDLHLLADRPPIHRIDGRIQPAPAHPLSAEQVHGACDAVLTDAQRERFAATGELCFSLQLDGLGFFRVNLARELGRTDASIRIAPKRVPSLEELGVPEVLLDLVRRPDGLVLVTGPTGVGKTTTLNALIGRVNAEERKKIVMIEDPIEFVHPHGRALVVQREIGADTGSFQGAVVHALRQDPDMVVIGEMRDLETISTALTAAETGHLVMATLHTTGAIGTIRRVIDVFPAHQQPQVRTQLAGTLAGVLTQRLLPLADGTGRVMAYELLVVTDAVRNMIREDKAHQLGNVMQTGKSLGMQLMDHHVRDLYDAGVVTWDVALGAVGDRRLLERR
ncbi:MAG: PilT/PilU family type 4a pilus ATPase [Alphaproteobacteria bacterium]|nr:PilT/PilU family type 4a pilus ATPase [Alphaproteobacteria bacterium]